jgi:hypothetical protein
MINTYTIIPSNNVQEGSSFTATVYFRESDASTVPTTARYRIDDRTTGDAIRAWTDLTPAASIDISITPSDNAMVSGLTRDERRQITVETNTGLDTQTRERAYWTVKSIDEF